VEVHGVTPPRCYCGLNARTCVAAIHLPPRALATHMHAIRFDSRRILRRLAFRGRATQQVSSSPSISQRECPARWSAEREGGSIHVRTMRPRGTELLGMAGPTRTACSHLSDPACPSPIYPSYIEVVGHRTPKHILPRNVNRVLDMSNIRSVQTRARGRHFAASSRYSGDLRTSTSVAAPRKQGHHICLEMMIARNRPNLVQFSQLSPTRKWATNEAHTFTSSPELNPFHSSRLVAKPRKADKDTHPWSASPLRRPCSLPHAVPAPPSSSARSPAGPWAWSRVRAKARLLLVLARWFSPSYENDGEEEDAEFGGGGTAGPNPTTTPPSTSNKLSTGVSHLLAFCLVGASKFECFRMVLKLYYS
jgi:hypothetical protein